MAHDSVSTLEISALALLESLPPAAQEALKSLATRRGVSLALIMHEAILSCVDSVLSGESQRKAATMAAMTASGL